MKKLYVFTLFLLSSVFIQAQYDPSNNNFNKQLINDYAKNEVASVTVYEQQKDSVVTAESIISNRYTIAENGLPETEEYYDDGKIWYTYKYNFNKESNTLTGYMWMADTNTGDRVEYVYDEDWNVIEMRVIYSDKRVGKDGIKNSKTVFIKNGDGCLDSMMFYRSSGVEWELISSKRYLFNKDCQMINDHLDESDSYRTEYTYNKDGRLHSVGGELDQVYHYNEKGLVKYKDQTSVFYELSELYYYPYTYTYR